MSRRACRINETHIFNVRPSIIVPAGADPSTHRAPVQHRTHTFTLILRLRGRLQSPINLKINVFGLWEETCSHTGIRTVAL